MHMDDLISVRVPCIMVEKSIQTISWSEIKTLYKIEAGAIKKSLSTGNINSVKLNWSFGKILLAKARNVLEKREEEVRYVLFTECNCKSWFYFEICTYQLLQFVSIRLAAKILLLFVVVCLDLFPHSVNTKFIEPIYFVLKILW